MEWYPKRGEWDLRSDDEVLEALKVEVKYAKVNMQNVKDQVKTGANDFCTKANAERQLRLLAKQHELLVKRHEEFEKRVDESQNLLLPKRPKNLIGLYRPTSSYSLRMASRDREPRHRMIDVMDLDFDYGEKIAKDFDSAKREIQHQRMLKDALHGEMDEVVDASSMSGRMTYSGSGIQSSSGRRTRPKSARHKRH